MTREEHGVTTGHSSQLARCLGHRSRRRTSLRTSISATAWSAIRVNEQHKFNESLTSKRFRALSAASGQPRMEISGFGVRVPGGAQKPRSRECPGFLHACRSSLTHLFAATTAEADLGNDGSDASRGLHLIVTVRHITTIRIVATIANPAPGPALSSQPRHRLEA